MSNRYLTTDEAAGPDDVHSITATPEPHTKDMVHRMKVYSLQMGLRVVCLLVFVVVDNIYVRAVALLGVAILPWMAVMLANSGADRSARTTRYYEAPAAPALEARPDGDPRTGAPVEDVVLEGEFTSGHGEIGPGRPAPAGAEAPSGPSDSSARVGDGPPDPGGAGPARPRAHRPDRTP
ncbi:DUF3099 domain-containing protein [Kocuria sp. M1R5S2]|uniref:DUF3099 domain-containing protein n=1 Tax=Kocuria rhizosphaerae TaxID=3376285 RepID=UPI00379AB1F0